jgi:uncharacterized membrane protein
MASVTVLKFGTANGAADALVKVRSLQQRHLIVLHDAAIVTWPAGAQGPETRQLVDLVKNGAVGGVFWGLLIGFIFVTPLFGMAIGAALGALGGTFRDYGIDDNFIKQVRGAVTVGTSALFLMTSDAVLDRVAKEMKDTGFEFIATNLSREQEQRLRDAFAPR